MQDYTYNCPTCGTKLRSTSCRAINTHERSKRHKEAVEKQGYATPSAAYDRAAHQAWARLVTTPGATDTED